MSYEAEQAKRPPTGDKQAGQPPRQEKEPAKSPRKPGANGAAPMPGAGYLLRGGEPGGGGEADELDGELDLGDEASGVEPGLREKAERSLGASLGGVKVHRGEKSAKASQKRGAKAFTHGQDVVLGAGVANDANPVMAHELAHTAQQKGAAPGIAEKSERGPQGSAHEVEADQAAGHILAGIPTRISQVGAERVQCFEGAEHMELGNAGFGEAPVTVGKVKLAPGVFTALMGDFYGTWDKMKVDCENDPAKIYRYRDVLVREGKLRDLHRQDPANNAEPDSNGAIMLASGSAAGAKAYLDLASVNFNHFGDQSPESNKVFDQVVKDNPAYAAEVGAAKAQFGFNVGQYLEMHLKAAGSTFKAGLTGGPERGEGMAMDASACHFLTDAFASGHMRTPRSAMYKEYQQVFKDKGRRWLDQWVGAIPNQVDVVAALGVSVPSILRPSPISLVSLKTSIKQSLYGPMDGAMRSVADSVAGFGAKALHDFDNENGLKVHNLAGQSWEAKGDHSLADSTQNEKIAVQCVAASAAHMKAMYQAGKEGAAAKKQGKEATMPFRSLKPITNLIPIVDKSNAKPGEEAPGGARDWHWATMNDKFYGQIKTNAQESVTGTISSLSSALAEKVKTAVEAKVRTLLSGLGRVGEYLADQAGALVSWIMSYLPHVDASQLVATLLGR